mmetsp:Transcript_44391/g.76934  ORF Transcript_44391/g.76934 Transcript_44391/m.76934 type:complete len:760 (-) Transcript_44391:45-2324(-)
MAQELNLHSTHTEVDALCSPRQGLSVSVPAEDLKSPPSSTFASLLASRMRDGGKTKDVSKWFQIKWSRRTSLEGFETPVEPPPSATIATPEPMDEIETPAIANLDEAWVELRAEDGFAYFWDRRSNSCTWDLPSGVRPKWNGQKAQDGRTYYWRIGDQKTYWSLPILQDLPHMSMGGDAVLEEETPTLTNQQHFASSIEGRCTSEGAFSETPVLASRPTKPGSHAEMDLLRLFGYSEAELQEIQTHASSDGNAQDCICETPVLPPIPVSEVPRTVGLHDTHLPTPPLPAADIAYRVQQQLKVKVLADEGFGIPILESQDLQDGPKTSNNLATDGCMLPEKVATNSTSVLQTPLLPKSTARICSNDFMPQAGSISKTQGQAGVGLSIVQERKPGVARPCTQDGVKHSTVADAAISNPEHARVAGQPCIVSSMAPVLTIVPTTTPNGRTDKLTQEKAHGSKGEIEAHGTGRAAALESRSAPAGDIREKDGKIDELKGKLDATTQDSTRLKVEVAILKKQLAAAARMRSAMEKNAKPIINATAALRNTSPATQPKPVPPSVANTGTCDKNPKAALKDDELVQRIRALRQRPSTAAATIEQEPPLKRQRPSTAAATIEQEPPLKRQRRQCQSDMSSGSSNTVDKTRQGHLRDSSAEGKRRDAKESRAALSKKENRAHIDNTNAERQNSKMPRETRVANASESAGKAVTVDSDKENAILDKFMTEIIHGKPPGTWEVNTHSEVKPRREGSLASKRSRRASRGGA